ncbi:chemotaxis protein CheW [Archangium lipolyticum]|uniref:chemotaxis protein CheW n=1 Tax=Archangium lipolyticum TaxID=2970465 RepID=UPI002149BA56|nr:chemotaxis protein CheW [Archangium lipolyticum]
MRQRFNVLSQPRPDEAAAREERDPLVQLCAFFVGPEEYAVDIMRVEEILPPQRLTPIRGAPPFIEGVIHLRGSIIPVVDLRKRLLGGEAPPATPKTRLLVCWLGRRRVALVVDRVSEVVRMRRSEIKPAPAIGAVGPAPFVVGVCGPPERLKLLLDVKALLLAELVRDTGRRMNG